MKKIIATGNEMVSLPCIDEADASIYDMTFLHMGLKGMIDVRGNKETPFLTPFVIKDKAPVTFKNLQWSKENFWIPTFVMESGEERIEGTILTPIGQRGFALKLSVTNKCSLSSYRLGFRGCWRDTYHSINEDKLIEAPKYVYSSLWNNAPVFDLRIGGAATFSFAPVFEDETTKAEYIMKADNEVEWEFSNEWNVEEGETKDFIVYMGLGYEEVASTTSAKEMKRRGYKEVLEETKKWLSQRQRKIKNAEIAKRFHENLFFSFFYASGKTIDTEEFVLVTSRSPRYYVSAAYWDRDSLIWSFPSILLVDSKYAKEMLNYVYKKQIRNVGIHSRYIDGTVLEPGFELDELCAPILALYNYYNVTKDVKYLKKDYIMEGIGHILDILDGKKHESLELYETFLQPTDDMRIYPYITYDNVLVWKSLKALAQMYKGIWEDELILELEQRADRLKKTIMENCVFEYKGKKMFAWSVDTKGKWDIYDEPPGSLLLLNYYGFCETEDEIYRNTVECIHRPDYKYSFHGYKFAEIGCAHAPHPWILSISNTLLCNKNIDYTDMICEAEMDNGIACESIDENTGKSVTGEAFATCAGFFAYALYQVYGEQGRINE